MAQKEEIIEVTNETEIEALDDENCSNGAIDFGYTAENLNDRINATKNEGVYVNVAFDSQYT